MKPDPAQGLWGAVSLVSEMDPHPTPFSHHDVPQVSKVKLETSSLRFCPRDGRNTGAGQVGGILSASQVVFPHPPAPHSLSFPIANSWFQQQKALSSLRGRAATRLHPVATFSASVSVLCSSL